MWVRFWIYIKLLFFFYFIFVLDMCIMLIKLVGNEDCLLDNVNVCVKNCVVKYIIVELCIVVGGNWIKFIINYLEKIGGNVSNCEV